MFATVLLCDFAEEVGGKLYIMGGGWSRLKRPRVPTTMCLAVKLSIPWEEAEATHKLKADLVTSDNETVMVGDNPVRVIGELRPSRDPSDVDNAIPADVNLALRFDAVILEPGRYEWRFEVDDQVLARIPLLVSQQDDSDDA
jgi:hypothetical protein